LAVVLNDLLHLFLGTGLLQGLLLVLHSLVCALKDDLKVLLGLGPLVTPELGLAFGGLDSLLESLGQLAHEVVEPTELLPPLALERLLH